MEIFDINEVFSDFLNLTSELPTSVWHGVSELDNENFYWVNVFNNNKHRNEVLNTWTSNRNSGLIAKQLKSVGNCSIPKLYYFPWLISSYNYGSATVVLMASTKAFKLWYGFESVSRSN